MAYYSTALHELGHWTGHDSRLNRDLSSPFGTDGYAKEELRAEIASFMLSCELGIDFDPTNHGAYVNSWCRNLTEEPKEIFKASADAVKIKNFVMELTLEKEVEKVQEVTKSKEDIVLQNRQEVGDYMKELQAQYPNFVVTYGMSLKTNSLYSNYIMADKDNKSIRTLDISPKGAQEWGTISPERAIERLENSYKAYLVKEWGLDKTVENEKRMSDEISLEQREIEQSMENHYVFPNNPIISPSQTRFDVHAVTKHFRDDPMTQPTMTIPKEQIEDAILRYGTMEIKDDNNRLLELNIGNTLYQLAGSSGSIYPRDYMDTTPFEKDNAWDGATVTVLTPYNDPELMAIEKNKLVVENELMPLLEQVQKGQEVYHGDIQDVCYHYQHEMERKGIVGFKFPMSDNNSFHNNQKEVLEHYLSALSPEMNKEVDYHSDPLVAETKRLTNEALVKSNFKNSVEAIYNKGVTFSSEGLAVSSVSEFFTAGYKADYGTLANLANIEFNTALTPNDIEAINELVTNEMDGNISLNHSEEMTMQAVNEHNQYLQAELYKEVDYHSDPLVAETKRLTDEAFLALEKSYPKIQNPNAKYPDATVLHVPYKEKELAGSLGARWEQSEKTWCAPVGTDLGKLANWLVAPEPKKTFDSPTPQAEFAEALRAKGLILDGEPIMDGKLYRVPVEGDKGKQKSGSYRGHLDGRPAGFIHNFKDGSEPQNWKAQGFSQENVVSLMPTPEQQEAQKALNAEREATRQKELLAKHNEVSVNVRTKFNEAREVGDNHQYLEAKGVKNYGLKLAERNNLYMPLVDIDDKMWSAQAINVGFKGFEKDGKKEGNFFIIGEHHSTSKELLICEGYATGASIHEATGKGVIVAVDAGNLENVGLALRERYPDKVIAFMADDDIAKATDGKKNVGLISAENASELTRGIVIYPQLTTSEIKEGKSDFNDIHKSRGLAELKAQLSIKLDKLVVREDKAPQKQQEKEAQRGIER